MFTAEMQRTQRFAQRLIYASRTTRSLRLFAHDFSGLLILTQPEESRLAQMMVAGPFGKADLANQLWFDPLATAHLSGRKSSAASGSSFRKICEGTIGLSHFLKLPIK